MRGITMLGLLTLPAASVATRVGSPTEALAAAIGVGGGEPPAIVEITYCCAQPLPHNSKSPRTR